MKKRIALFTSQFPGKVSTFFSRDLYILLHYGYEVDVFTVYPVQHQYWKFVPRQLRVKIEKKISIKYINPIHCSWKNINSEILKDIKVILKQSISYGPIQFAKSVVVIQQALIWGSRFDGKYDYMLSYWGNYAATYAFIANKLLKNEIPFSFFLHAGTDLYRDQIFLEQKILQAKKIFTVCEYNREFLQKLYPQSFKSFEANLELYHLGLDFDDIKYEINGRETYTLLTIGSFSKRKGFSLAIKTLTLLTSEFPSLKLIMIGDGPEKSKLKKMARTHGVEKHVEFTGWITFEEVKKYLARCTILIHPSCTLGDAVPTVIKEAMAAGLPVIGSNIAGIPELLDNGNAGVLFPPRDHIELAASIRRLLLEPDIRKFYAMKGRSFAMEKFDMWKNGSQLSAQLKMNL